jgi:hypothetical protein
MNATDHTAHILPAIWKLLRLRARITFNTFRHAKLIRKILIIVTALMLLGLAGFIFFLSTEVLGFLRSPDLARYIGIDPAPLLQAIPVVITTGMFMGILLTSFGVLLQALYLAGDMDFLLSFPVPIRAVFVSKLLQAVLPNLGLFSMFGLPILLGLGITGGYPFIYYPLVLLIIIMLTLAGSGLAALLVMMVARVFPARRAAEVLAFLGATLGIACSQIFNLSQNFGEGDVSGDQFNKLSGLLTKANTPWLPLNWAGQGLVDIGEGRWLSGTVLVLLTFGLCALAFWVSLATAERWYYSGWARMQVVARKKSASQPARPPTGSATFVSAWADRILTPPVRAIIGKDFLVLRRDLRNLSQLISPLILGGMYTVMLLRSGGEPPAGQGEAPGWFMEAFRLVLSFGSVGMSLFVGWMLLSRLAVMGFSQEGKSYWTLKAAPLRASQLLLAKFLVSYLPALALGFFFVVIISIMQWASVGVFLYSLATVALCMAGMNGIMTGFGAAGANFDWDDPRKMNNGLLGCLGQLATMLYLPVSLALFLGPLWLAAALQLPLVVGYLIGLLLGGGIVLGFAILPLILVRKRVERLGEK